MHLRSKFATAAFLSLVMAGPAVVAAMDNGSSNGIATQEKKGNSQNQGQRGNSGNHGNRGGNNGSGGEDLTHIRFAALDTNHDGQITRDEWRGNQNSFNQHDWNGDGVLSGIEVTPGAQRPAQGSTFDRLDTNHDGRIALSEWTGDRATFDRLDLNHDGFLTRAELQNNTQGNQGNNTFDRLDTNHDGRIALSEWRGDRATFDRLDTNHDGFLSRDELQNNTQGGRRDHFSLLDTNGDGRIALSEWTGDRATFDRLDLNHDGFLTREEFTGLSNDGDDDDDSDDDDGR